MCNVVLAGAIAPLAWDSALSLSIGMACLALISAACYRLYHRLSSEQTTTTNPPQTPMRRQP
jgi:hypothetical protein